jgi:hypothetical protein
MITAVLGTYGFIAFFTSFYIWATATDRSQSPLERRITAAVLSLAWPYGLYKWIQRKRSPASGKG